MLGPIKTDYAWSGPSGVSEAPVPVHSGASGGQFEETRARASNVKGRFTKISQS